MRFIYIFRYFGFHDIQLEKNNHKFVIILQIFFLLSLLYTGLFSSHFIFFHKKIWLYPNTLSIDEHIYLFFF